ncbi:COX15/CtaA family protein [Roseateles saccharophilus]|uniref:Cytochrome c oxidase assembly protein subunit 15 n=1 Tax=Roseateles saccharophilus TaxID=304 RepID=A0A4R3V5Y6_ROSSA|nr:COX15/CtaA family protein [Roseateles saccharophilus]MDG0833733.1 heme A synthase [Roseateles saccharophilus]TCU98813.1 cytochrome c oxidase assembly protein subunit 15 [Roseateles saccharophilus]
MNELLLPLGQVAAIGGAVALGPLIWWRQRSRAGTPTARLRALTLLALFLTFDLIVFGAFTRLTDSGLGCPDWPGCYSAASPVGAHGHIEAAQAAMPTGPVTHTKAWIEMLHRYLASAVGLLILTLAVLSWRLKRQDGEAAPSPWWPTASLAWVCVVGAFGRLTVTMKLFPIIVTGHLLLAIGLLMLMAWQREGYEPRPLAAPAWLRGAVAGLLLLVLAQVALGGWVSTNYAVLACDEFPSCHGGQWWPHLDFAQGFQLWRELGQRADGGYLGFEALAAIHMAHRIGAALVFAAVIAMVLALRRHAPAWSRWLLAAAGWQLATGLSNVVLDWPIAAALAHTGGAAVLLALLITLLARLSKAQP